MTQMKGAIALAFLLGTGSPAAGQTESLVARDGKFLPNVVLHDRLKTPALVDLGATSVVICESMAQALGVPRGEEAVLGTVGGHLPAHRTRLRSIRLGRIELDDVKALILGDEWCEEVLLGMSFLRHLRLTLNGDVLTLRRERPKRKKSSRRD